MNHHGPLVNETTFVYYKNAGFQETYTPRAVENLAKYFGCAGGPFPLGGDSYLFWVSSMYNRKEKNESIPDIR